MAFFIYVFFASCLSLALPFFCIHTYIEWNLMIIGPWRTDRDAAAAGGMDSGYKNTGIRYGYSYSERVINYVISSPAGCARNLISVLVSP